MKRTNYWPRRGLALKSATNTILISLLALIISCKSDKLHWSTKKENTLEFIPEVDSVLVLEGISKNPKYGYSPQYPIKLGVTSEYTSAAYPEKYLQSITGPNGEPVAYKRIKSCCFFKTVNSDATYQNVGVLEMYEVTYAGLSTPKTLYLNFFDQGVVFAPQGFIPKKTSNTR